jgi:hypothetical protein
VPGLSFVVLFSTEKPTEPIQQFLVLQNLFDLAGNFVA